MNIGENIRKIRKSKNLTQTELAESIGISRSYLGDLENNRKNISTKTLKELANKLNVSISQIINLDSEDFSPLNTGLKLYQLYLKSCNKDSLEHKALLHYKNSYKLNTIIESGVYNIMSIPLLKEKFSKGTNIIKDAENPFIKDTFLETFTNEYIENEKNDNALILKTINQLKDIIPTDDYAYYPDRIQIMNEDSTGILISVYENNLSIDLIDQLQKKLKSYIEEIELLKNTYTNKNSQKFIEYKYIDRIESKFIIENIGVKAIDHNNFKSKSEYEKYLVMGLNEVAFKNNENIDKNILNKIKNSKFKTYYSDIEK